MEIILLRHGKPIMPSLEKIKAFSFRQWVETYDSSELCLSSKPNKTTTTRAKKCGSVVCSDLMRSIQSAEALNIKNITLSESQFNEAGLPSANWGILKLSPKTWAVIFRTLWLFGYSNNSESYKEAKIRASDSANKLIDLAKEHGSVLFVGHGIYNRLLAKKLKSLGWSGPSNPGTKHWSFGVYKN